jgi:hypothetical protein
MKKLRLKKSGRIYYAFSTIPISYVVFEVEILKLRLEQERPRLCEQNGASFSDGREPILGGD